MDTDANEQEPIIHLTIGQTQVSLLGTAHVSRASANKVKELINTGGYDTVAVELCQNRYNAIINPESLAKMNLFQVIREKKAMMVVASLALGAFQQRLADQFGIKPGEEMRAAISTAKLVDIPVRLIDREIGTTLKRVYRTVSWWRRLHIASGLFYSVISRENVNEDDIEKLKQGDLLETTFAQFSDRAHDLYVPLIDERDRYMSARIKSTINKYKPSKMLVIVGAGHLLGMKNYLQQENNSPDKIIAELDLVPSPARWPKIIPWAIVVLIFVGFAFGFKRSPEFGWELITDWIVINGGLAAFGALIAGAHFFTVITAFVAAPITSLNPMIGAGVVTAAVEVYIRKPKVGDFSRLRHDTSSLKGWWNNRVTRILLIFMMSTLGSSIGT